MTELNDEIDLINDTSISYTFFLFGAGGNAVVSNPTSSVTVPGATKLYEPKGGGGSGAFIQIEAPRLIENTQLIKASVISNTKAAILLLTYLNGYTIQFKANGGSDGSVFGGSGGSTEVVGQTNYVTYSAYNGVQGGDVEIPGGVLKTSSGSGIVQRTGLPYVNGSIVVELIGNIAIENRGSGKDSVAIGYGSGGAPIKPDSNLNFLTGTRKAIFYLKNN